MSDTQSMIQTEVAIDAANFVLAQDQDVSDLRSRIEAAAGTPGTFVDFVVVGNRAVSVLIGPGSRVMITVSTVAFDVRDTGDVNYPYGGYFDMI